MPHINSSFISHGNRAVSSRTYFSPKNILIIHAHAPELYTHLQDQKPVALIHKSKGDKYCTSQTIRGTLFKHRDSESLSYVPSTPQTRIGLRLYFNVWIIRNYHIQKFKSQSYIQSTEASSSQYSQDLTS